MSASVIIPVFNLENYIINNLESMIRQEGEDNEFIYIDDGSTDNSLQILREYQKKDDRIKIISQKNMGQSVARNRGMQEAKGEVVFFVDGDDYIAEGSLKMLTSMMLYNDLEVLLTDQKIVYSIGDENCTEQKTTECEKIITGIELMKEKSVFTNCLYIYRRSFIEQNHIRFMEGVYHEDMDFVPRALYYAHRTMKVDYTFYFHVMRNESTTHTSCVKRSKDLFQIANSLSNFITNNSMKSSDRAYFEQYRISLYSQGIHVAFINGFKVSDLICGQLERKNLVKQLRLGNRKNKFVACMLYLHLDEIYREMYLRYNEIRNRCSERNTLR